jgi:hypothetical protein
VRKHIFVLIAYTVIALVITFPLVLNFTTAIPGVEGDTGSFVWALGWMKSALELGVNPFRSDYVFYPLGGATQLIWAVSFIALLALPLQTAFGMIVTYNILYLAATVLTAWGMFLLAEDVLQRSEVRGQRSEVRGQRAAGREQKSKVSEQWAESVARPLPPFQTFLVYKFVTHYATLAPRVSHFPAWLAPFVAGVVFACAPLRLGYGLAFFNLYNTQLIPFYVLFLRRALRHTSPRHAVLAGILLGLNGYIDFQIAAFLVLLTALYACGQLITHPLLLSRVLSLAALSALVALLVVAPLLTVVVNDFASEGGNYIRVFPLKYSAERSYDLLAFFVPNAYSTLYAGAPLKIAGINAPLRPNDGSALSPDRQVFVGYVVLALAVYATLRAWQRARGWLVLALLFAGLALGPSLRIAGHDTTVPLPYLVLHQIPIINHIRIPMRYGIVVMFALAMLAAMAVHSLRAGVTGFKFQVARLALLLLPVLILCEYAMLPYPLQRIQIPRVYEQIAREPGDFAILEIPTFNWRHAAMTEMYQPIHRKRILRAYTNRIAPGIAEYFGTRGIPIVVRSLRALEGAQKEPLTDEEMAEDQHVRDAVVQFYDLRYAVLHRDLLQPTAARALEAYLREVLGANVIAEEGAVVVYALPRVRHVAERVEIDLRELVGQMYAGRGWQFEYPPANWRGEFNFVWARGASSEIYFVAPARACVMLVHARAASPQRVQVVVNNTRSGEMALDEEWQTFRLVLPTRAGMNRVRLEYGAPLYETIGVTTITLQCDAP